MEIVWLGQSCFRLRGRDATVVTNPCPPSTGYKIGKLSADIVLVSRRIPENDFRQALNGEPKYVQGPGEYEIAGVLISGVHTDPAGAAPRNTAYVFDLDDVRVCFLGDIARVPGADEVESLGAADVLIVPVGGGRVLDAQKAAETVSLLEPKLVIPMNFRTEVSDQSLAGVDAFLKEMGAEAREPETRANITRSSVPADTSITVLGYRA